MEKGALTRRHWAAVTVLSAAGLAAVFGAAHAVLAHRTASVVTAAETLRARERALQAAAPAAAVNEHQAALQRLTANAPGHEAVIKDVRRAGAGLGVSLVAVSSSQVPATAQSLGRLDLVLTLGGSYANIKALLDEVMARHASIVLRGLAFRRMSSPSELQARVSLSLVSPPVMAATQSGPSSKGPSQ